MTVTYMIATAAGLVLAVVAIGPRRVFRLDSFSGLFLVVFALAYVVRPLIGWATDDTAAWMKLRLPSDRTDLLDKMAMANCLALAAFAVGFGLRRPTEQRKARKALRPAADKRLALVGVVFVAAGWLCILLFNPLPFVRGESVAESETLENWEGAGYTQGTAYVIQGNYFVISGAALFYAATGQLGAALVFLAPLLASRLWWGWGRQSMLFALLVAWYLTVARVREGTARRRTLCFLAFLGLALLCVLPVLAEERAFFREFHGTPFEALLAILERVPALFSSATTVAGFEPTAHWLYYTPDVFPYQYGNRYLYSLVLLPIPRLLWPEKRNLFAEWLGTEPGIDTQYLYGAAPGIVGDGYQNFGVLGIALFLWAAGAVLGRLEEMSRSGNTPLRRAGVALVFCVTPLLVRSGFASLAPLLFFFGLPLAAGHFARSISRLPRRRGCPKAVVRLRWRATGNNRATPGAIERRATEDLP